MSLIKTYTDTDTPVFLASTAALRLATFTAPQALGTAEDGYIYVKAGTVYPSNDGNAEGIVFQDVNVTKGDAPGSLMTAGHVYEDRFTTAVASAAKTALKAKGIIFEAAPTMDRLH